MFCSSKRDLTKPASVDGTVAFSVVGKRNIVRPSIEGGCEEVLSDHRRNPWKNIRTGSHSGYSKITCICCGKKNSVKVILLDSNNAF